MPPTGLLAPRRAGALQQLTPGRLAAAAMILAICGGLFALLHYSQAHVAERPLLVMLFPPAAMLSIAAVLPLMMFISYQDDFRGLNPLHPLHYAAIARRCYAALGRSGSLKVSEKDL